MKKVNKFLIALLVLAIGVVSCSDDEKQETGMAKVQVALVDAPGDYEAVMIDVKDVLINVGEDEKGWKSLDAAKAGVYDLLQLTNGKEAFLGEIELPQGKLAQIRLVLGDENKLKINGETVSLKVPSGSQSGLKLNVGADIAAGVTYKLLLDFDVAKSVVKAGKSGKYNLKPVLRAKMEAQTGAISGVVEPKDEVAVVYAINSKNDSISAYTDVTGAFLIRALPADTYQVVAVPKDLTTYEEVKVKDVLVETGKQKNIEKLTLVAVKEQ